MRPVPAKKHVLSLVIFVAISILCGYLAFEDHRFTDEQYALAAAAAVRHDPSLLALDSVYGEVHAEGRLVQMHSPVFLALMDLTLQPTNYTDAMLPFRVGVAPMTFVFLAGMYSLLWRQCRSSTLSAYLAVLSMTITETLGPWQWGVGTVATVTPAGAVVCLSPLLLIAYLKHRDQTRQLIWCFLAIGLCANLHLASACNLALVLLLVHLGLGRLRGRAWLGAVAGAGCFVLGAGPYLLSSLLTQHSIAAGASFPAVSSADALRALAMSHLEVLYPQLLPDLLRWGLYVGTLAALAGLMLWKVHRYRVRNIRLWAWVAGMAAVVALGFHGVAQGVARLLDRPPYIHFLEASVWVMPAMYVLFGLALTLLFRMMRRNRRPLQWACGLFMVAWMMPSDNFRPIRHEMYRLGSSLLSEADRPMRVQELRDEEIERAELQAIATWAREQTDPRSVFLADLPEFRPWSCRSLFVCRSDIRQFYAMAPWLLEEWTQDVQRQYRWVKEPFEAEAVLAGVEEILVKPGYRDSGPWYLLLPARLGEPDSDRLEHITSPQWGRYWRVYRLSVTPAATTRPGEPTHGS
jgi:hypothetical protein